MFWLEEVGVIIMTEHKEIKSLQLFPHQQEGIDYLRGEGPKALFDEPGLGKTRQIIEATQADMDQGLVKGALVICPNSIKSTWQSEVEKYSHYKPVVFGNSFTERRRAYLHLRPSFYIINYEAVLTEKENLKRLLKFRAMALILDESQRIKNPDAKVTQTIMELRDLAKKRIIMTGTPVANHPEDLWSQFLFLDGVELLGESFAQFKTRCSCSSDTDMNRLQEILVKKGLRRRKDEVLDLPTKHYINHEVKLIDTQSVMYHKIREEMYLWVKSMDGKEVLKNAENILTRMLRLVQIASNPRLIDASYYETPAKFAALDILLEELFKGSPEQKVIVWSSFVDNINELTGRYERYKAVPVHGRLDDRIREFNLKSFHNNPNVRILVANPAAAREGLTLTEANVAIYLDRTFNLTDYLQSQDRIHRISQERECFIINLIAQGTIDDFISYVLQTKQQTAEFIQSDRSSLPREDVERTRSELLQALL